MLGTHRMHMQLISSYLRKPKTVLDQLFYMWENSKLLQAEIETRAEIVCYRSFVPEYSDIMDKTQPIQGNHQQVCVCMYVCICVCVYVCVCVCVCVFEIQIRGWKDLCWLSQQTSGYMLLHRYLHTPMCAHIIESPLVWYNNIIT